MTVGPFRDFQTARIMYLEERERVLLEEIARLRRPPLWQRMGAHPLFQGAWHFLALIGTWLLGAALLIGCLLVLCLFEAGYWQAVSFFIDASVACEDSMGLPPPRFRQDSDGGDAGVIADVFFTSSGD
jgi:hypothetical protein